jgi:hypothetical protein
VEHRGEHFTIIRRGKVVAQLDPVHSGSGAEVKALLQRHGLDPGFAEDVLYRIVYGVLDECPLVHVVRVGHRRDVNKE